LGLKKYSKTVDRKKNFLLLITVKFIILDIKVAGERLDISIYLFKAYARSATNDSDIARNIHDKLCSVKSLVYALMIARAFNRVAENILHF